MGCRRKDISLHCPVTWPAGRGGRVTTDCTSGAHEVHVTSGCVRGWGQCNILFTRIVFCLSLSLSLSNRYVRGNGLLLLSMLLSSTADRFCQLYSIAWLPQPHRAQLYARTQTNQHTRINIYTYTTGEHKPHSHTQYTCTDTHTHMTPLSHIYTTRTYTCACMYTTNTHTHLTTLILPTCLLHFSLFQWSPSRLLFPPYLFIPFNKLTSRAHAGEAADLYPLYHISPHCCCTAVSQL